MGGARNSAAIQPSERSAGSRTVRQARPSTWRSGPITSSSTPSKSPFNRAPAVPGFLRRLTPSVPAPTTRTCSDCPAGFDSISANSDDAGAALGAVSGEGFGGCWRRTLPTLPGPGRELPVSNSAGLPDRKQPRRSATHLDRRYSLEAACCDPSARRQLHNNERRGCSIHGARCVPANEGHGVSVEFSTVSQAQGDVTCALARAWAHDGASATIETAGTGIWRAPP